MEAGKLISKIRVSDSTTEKEHSVPNGLHSVYELRHVRVGVADFQRHQMKYFDIDQIFL